MRAAIVYLRTMRKERSLPEMAVVMAMRGYGGDELEDLSANYVWRIESGKIKKPGVQHLLAFARAVGATMDAFTDLLLKKDATVEEGLRQAYLELVGPEKATEMARKALAAHEFEAESAARRPLKSNSPRRRSSQREQSPDTEEETEES